MDREPPNNGIEPDARPNTAILRVPTLTGAEFQVLCNLTAGIHSTRMLIKNLESAGWSGHRSTFFRFMKRLIRDGYIEEASDLASRGAFRVTEAGRLETEATLRFYEAYRAALSFPENTDIST